MAGTGSAGGAALAPAGRPTLLVGVMGHVDHGKTALVRALTGTDTDRLGEEKARGISITLGFAVLRKGGAEVDIVDMPGHERFLRAMVAGATGIEAALIVVSAAEGVREQTREHLEIASLLGVTRGVIAVAQCDRVPADVAEAAGAEASRVARRCGFGPLPVIPTSALTGQGVEALGAALAALAQEAPPRAEHGLFQLPVDRVFPVAGIGSVVTGTLRRGRLAVGDEVELAPGGRRARVRSLQLHGQGISAAGPGRRVAVGLRGVELAALRRGMVLASPGVLAPGGLVQVRLSVLPSAPGPLASGTALRLLSGTAETEARLRLPGGGCLRPGENAFAQLRCEPPLPVMAGDAFVLRLPSPPRTIGGGTILDPLAPRRRAGIEAAAERLGAAMKGEWPAATLLLLRELGPAGALPAALAPRTGHAPARIRAWALQGGARELPGGVLLHAEAWEALFGRLRAALAAFHARHPMEPGLRPEALRAALPHRAPPSVAEALIAALLADGAVVRENGLLRERGHDPARLPGGDERALLGAIEALFRAGGLMPPDPSAAAGKDARRAQAIRYLLGRGILVRATDQVQKRTILFHRDALDQAKRRIAEQLAGTEGFAAREVGALLGISRKYSIPLLEHLDAVSFTRRVGDLRVLRASQAVSRAAGRGG